jgi:FkbM family methyltransferase
MSLFTAARGALRALGFLLRPSGLLAHTLHLRREVDELRRLSADLAALRHEVGQARADLAVLSEVSRSRTSVLGHTMYLHHHDCAVSPCIWRYGLFEPSETALLPKLVREGDTVLDLGANIGYFTLLLARKVGPTGRVFAFEPDPDNFALLARNVEVNGYTNVVLENKAVGERTGTAGLFLCADNPGDHRIYATAGEARERVTIDTVRLDDYAPLRGARVDLIKMDIQGAEAGALAGMAGLLRRSAGCRLLTEFWPYGLRHAGADPRAYLEALRALGLELHRLPERGPAVPVDVDEVMRAYGRGLHDDFTNLLCYRPGAEANAA